MLIAYSFHQRFREDSMDIFETVKEAIVELCSINGDIITEDATMENIGIDSLDVVDVITSLEETFEISISDEDVENIETVGDIVELVEHLRED